MSGLAPTVENCYRKHWLNRMHFLSLSVNEGFNYATLIQSSAPINLDWRVPQVDLKNREVKERALRAEKGFYGKEWKPTWIYNYLAKYKNQK